MTGMIWLFVQIAAAVFCAVLAADFARLAYRVATASKAEIDAARAESKRRLVWRHIARPRPEAKEAK